MSAPVPRRTAAGTAAGPTATRTPGGGVRVTIPSLELPSSANARGHTLDRSGTVATIRDEVGNVLRVMAGPRLPLPCRVVITRVAPLGLDTDNADTAAKPVRDEVAVWLNPRVIQSGKKKGQVVGDDRDPRVEWLVAQEKGPAAVVIEVTPVVPWSTAAVSARAVLEGVATVAELTLDPARLERLAAELVALARGERAAPVSFQAAGSVVRLRVHRRADA